MKTTFKFWRDRINNCFSFEELQIFLSEILNLHFNGELSNVEYEYLISLCRNLENDMFCN
jgi:hypothetical protein